MLILLRTDFFFARSSVRNTPWTGLTVSWIIFSIFSHLANFYALTVVYTTVFLTTAKSAATVDSVDESTQNFAKICKNTLATRSHVAVWVIVKFEIQKLVPTIKWGSSLLVHMIQLQNWQNFYTIVAICHNSDSSTKLMVLMGKTDPGNRALQVSVRSEHRANRHGRSGNGRCYRNLSIPNTTIMLLNMTKPNRRLAKLCPLRTYSQSTHILKVSVQYDMGPDCRARSGTRSHTVWYRNVK